MKHLSINYNDKTRKNIEEYVGDMGYEVAIINSMPTFIMHFIRGSKKKMFILSNRFLRGLCRLRKIPCINSDNLDIDAMQYKALKEAFLYLNNRQIPCYMYNRIGTIYDFNYAPSARRRMKLGLSFPKMFENIDKYETEFKELLGDKYSKEYIKQLGNLPQIIFKGNHYEHEDYKSTLINVVGGKRVTLDQPLKCSRRLHVYGRCGVFGYAVEDGENIPSQLQKLFCENSYNDISVINHGLWGGDDRCIYHNILDDVSQMKQGDIVLIYMKHFEKKLLAKFEELGMWYNDITNNYHQNPKAKWCFYDRPGHMNREGYKIVAKLIFDDLVKHNFIAKSIPEQFFQLQSDGILNEYLENNSNEDFKRNLNFFINTINQNYPKVENIKKCGAIVMNCNPFTNGHRYLIEFASKQVDRLYIFVVEEDKSFFPFSVRFNMVKLGLSDIDNAVVIPSGKFMISSLTFPEYFLKDFVKEKDFDVSLDLEIFCKNIAPALNISIRFAGEEPLDPVTENYNSNMRNFLPAYGLEFYEIPRLEIEGLGIITATRVRELLKEKQYDKIKSYVPETTYQILKELYFK